VRLIASAVVICLAPAASPEQGQDRNLNRTLASIQQHIEAGDLVKASESIFSALERYPKAAGLFNLRGIIQARQEKLAAARADFERAVVLDPKLTPAWQNLARACQLLTSHDPSAAACAVDGWQRVASLRPSDTEARFSLATLYQWDGKFDESLRHLDKLPAAESSRSSVLAVRCADLAGLGRIKEANELALRLARAADVSDADAASIFPVLQSPKTAPVVVALVEALDSRKLASASSLRHLAVAYEQLNRMPDARKSLERVALLEPTRAQDLLELARIAYLSRDREGALGYLAHARDLAPGDAQVHFLFGMIAVEMDLPIEARQSLERALALDPHNASYNYAVGSVALSSRDASRAVPYFQTYVAAQPRDPRGHFALGVAYFATADYGRAREQMESIHNDPKTSAGAEYFLGRIARIEEKLDEAVTHLERSIALLPAFAESRAELGRVRLRQGLVERARADLNRALSIDPDSFQANANLLALYQRTHDARAAEQAERLQRLDAQRAARQELMLRTIEVKPY
jgi:tetratricopeptide (TPR) repeat protein